MINLPAKIKYLGATALIVASIGAQNARAITPYLISDFLKSSYQGDDSSFDFSKHASDSNGNGIYLNSESGTYYYRGEVDNNIIYANRCWQIMGTTTDGAVKFIYNGFPSENGACENIGNDSAALLNISYGAANNGSYVESNSKVELDAWFVDNLMDYADDFADVIYCNDTDYITAHKRIAEDGEPTFLCAEEHQLTVANGKLTYPIAIMSADELLFSGAGYGAAPADGADISRLLRLVKNDVQHGASASPAGGVPDPSDVFAALLSASRPSDATAAVSIWPKSTAAAALPSAASPPANSTSPTVAPPRLPSTWSANKSPTIPSRQV